MKFDVRRECGHVERVKVYAAYPHDAKKQEAHEARVLLHEKFKTCKRCRKEREEKKK